MMMTLEYVKESERHTITRLKINLSKSIPITKNFFLADSELSTESAVKNILFSSLNSPYPETMITEYSYILFCFLVKLAHLDKSIRSTSFLTSKTT